MTKHTQMCIVKTTPSCLTRNDLGRYPIPFARSLCIVIECNAVSNSICKVLC